ncbi:HAD-like protein, partial [Suhomyces tanzawaensis NRRL Y-17324]
DKSNSILTEDMLAKAGFEGEPKPEEEPTSEGSSEGSTRSRRKRRAQTSKDLQREKYANWFYILSFLGAGAGVGYMTRNWDSEDEQKSLDGLQIDNGYTPGLMYERFNKRWSSLFTFFSEPIFEQLLPPPAPEGYRRPLTLVLTLDDLLIHSSWDSLNGWRTAKRPGVDYFLRYLSQYYEIVVFASNYEMYSENVVKKLDPMQAAIQFALYREGCRYKDGKLIKDLSLLNRDLAKTVIVEVDEDAVSLQRENAVMAHKWDGKADDYLILLIPFLEYLATQPSQDVRPILNSFQDRYKIVDEFQQRELKLREQWKKENNKPNAGNFLASMLGAPALAKEPKMPLDVIREHGQYQYEQYEKFVEANIAKALEEEKKMKEKLGKTSLNKVFDGPPSAEEIARVQKE